MSDSTGWRTESARLYGEVKAAIASVPADATLAPTTSLQRDVLRVLQGSGDDLTLAIALLVREIAPVGFQSRSETPPAEAAPVDPPRRRRRGPARPQKLPPNVLPFARPR